MINAFVDIAKNKHDYETRKENKRKYIYDGFLFPNRMRYINESNGIYKKGDYVIVNLLNANLPFSYGPRACVGARVVDQFYAAVMDALKDFKLELLDQNDIIYHSDPNVPNIISHHQLKLSLPENYIPTVIPAYMKENLKFYRLEDIPKMPILFRYIIDSMTKMIKSEIIVTADARGFIFASPVAEKLGLPLIIIRKKGKLAGPTDTASYQKKYGEIETIEISTDSMNDLKGKTVTIIDDGIASGSTTKAMYNLIRSQGGLIDQVIVAVRHTYCDCEYKETPVSHLFII